MKEYYPLIIQPMFKQLSAMCNTTRTEKRDIQNYAYLIQKEVEDLIDDEEFLKEATRIKLWHATGKEV